MTQTSPINTLFKSDMKTKVEPTSIMIRPQTDMLPSLFDIGHKLEEENTFRDSQLFALKITEKQLTLVSTKELPVTIRIPDIMDHNVNT